MRRPHHRRPLAARRGVTLLELLVVLLLVGLGAALVAPALVRHAPADASDRALVAVVQRARTAAIRRGETLSFDVGADGRWTLVVAHADSLPIGAGSAAPDRTVPRRLLVTALGICLPDDPGGDGRVSWDAATCRPAASPAAR